MHGYTHHIPGSFPISPIDPLFGLMIAILLGLLLWSMIWKALALWAAARDNSKPWFIVFLLVHTLGILEILYLFVLREKTREEKAKE